MRPPVSSPIASQPAFRCSSTSWSTPRSIIFAPNFALASTPCRFSNSWAGILPAHEFDRWSLQPIKKIISGVREQISAARIIAFPRGAASHYTNFCQISGASALGLDTAVDPSWIASNLAPGIVVQGQLDPLALLAGGSAQTGSVDRILTAYRDRAHIFNLGHGILPETPIDHVAALINQVRSFEA